MRKPNTEDFGIDCSGFVVNAITGIENPKGHSLSTSTLDISASNIGNNYCRRLPVDENHGSNSYLTKNDIVYSRNHIAFCSDGNVDKNFNNEYVSKTHCENKDFNISHSYGNDFIYTPSGTKDDLFLMKNIQGAFRHWGVYLINTPQGMTRANLGRLYLWN